MAIAPPRRARVGQSSERKVAVPKESERRKRKWRGMDKKWGGFGKSSRIKLEQGRKDRGRRHMMHLGDEALTLLWRMR